MGTVEWIEVEEGIEESGIVVLKAWIVVEYHSALQL